MPKTKEQIAEELARAVIEFGREDELGHNDSFLRLENKIQGLARQYLILKEEGR
jgi:hypothetical protein